MPKRFLGKKMPPDLHIGMRIKPSEKHLRLYPKSSTRHGVLVGPTFHDNVFRILWDGAVAEIREHRNWFEPE